jgi:hypothetical protein
VTGSLDGNHSNQEYLLDVTKGEVDTWNFEICEEGNPMTIGIGVLCDGGETIVLASDMRTSYKRSAAPSDRGGKQYDFPPLTIAATVAGQISVCGAVASQMAYDLASLLAAKRKYPDELIVAQHVHRILNYARRKQLRAAQECAMEAELGVSLNAWLSGKLPNAERLDQLALRAGLSVLRRVKEDLYGKLAVIVGGFVENGIVFLRAVGAEPIEEASSPPVFVIGTGSRHAMDAMSRRGQNTDCTLARSLLHVYEALREARLGERDTVGPAAAYVVLRAQEGMMRFPAECPLVKDWYKVYRKRSSTHTLDSSVANHQAKCLLVKHQPRAAMILTHESIDCTAIQPSKFESH